MAGQRSDILTKAVVYQLASYKYNLYKGTIMSLEILKEKFKLEIFTNSSLKYFLHYEKLIETRKHHIFEKGKYENHHICPKCLNGTNNSDNTIYLTPKEHRIAHLLLHKMFPKNGKLIYAAHMMNVGSIKNLRENGKCQWIKSKLKNSIIRIGLRGPLNPMFGITGPNHFNFGKKRSKETCIKISESLKGEKHPLFGKYGLNNPNFGKTHSEETKKKLQKPKTEEHKEKLRKPKTEEHKILLSKIASDGRRKGKNNPCYGLKCINNGTMEKKVLETELKDWLNKGWILGRIPFSEEHKQKLKKSHLPKTI